MGPNQALFDKWGLEGSSWLLLALPGSSWGTQPVQLQEKEIAMTKGKSYAIFSQLEEFIRPVVKVV